MSDTTEQIPIYTVHDFDLLNKHADETYTRVRQITNVKRVGMFSRMALYTGILLLAIAAAAVLAAWAYSIVSSPPKQGTTVLEVPSDPSSDAAALRVLEQRHEDLEILNPAARGTVVKNFTLFETVQLGAGDIGSVVTGARFDSSKSKFPEHQYCYVELPLAPTQAAEGVAKTIYIADKKEGASINNYPINSVLADAAGTTIGVLERAQTQCRFR